MPNRNYGGIIWTNHALQRLTERGIKQGDAWAVWNRPEQSYKGNLHGSGDAYRYYRTFGNERIEVVAKKNERGEWVVLSVWSKKVFQNDKINKDNFWLSLLRKIFFNGNVS